jgi:hypothetical protein
MNLLRNLLENLNLLKIESKKDISVHNVENSNNKTINIYGTVNYIQGESRKIRTRKTPLEISS